jgi:O6-methylguanine-DNA--protein-cysteine methyltransferase
METYDALAELQKEDPRLQIFAISTATADNMDQIRQLTTYLFDRCPQMSQHHLAIIRGDRKNPSLTGPALEEYKALYDYVRQLWIERAGQRRGSIVDPMLQWAKCESARLQEQVIPCRAGVLSAVIHANGDVGVCEQRPPIGNLRKNSFMEIWHAHHTQQIRKSIKAKECYCTNEIFMWTSIVFQPVQLVKSMLGARVWRNVESLDPGKRVDYAEAASRMEAPRTRNKGAAHLVPGDEEPSIAEDAVEAGH